MSLAFVIGFMFVSIAEEQLDSMAKEEIIGVLEVPTSRTFNDVSLNGATIDVSGLFTAAQNAETGTLVELSGVNDVKSVGFTGFIEVAADSVITGRSSVVFGTDTSVLRIHVPEGVSLTVGCPSMGKVRKTGTGVLRFLFPFDGPGSMLVDEGSVELGVHARFADNVTVVTASGSSIVLNDGAAFPLGAMSARPILKTAEVWLDASRMSAKDGEAVPSVPNYGSVGGNWELFKTGDPAPGAPTYMTNAINGRSVIAFNGNQALVLDTYSNCSSSISIFMVWQQTAKSRWGGPIGLYSKDVVGTGAKMLHLEMDAGGDKMVKLSAGNNADNRVEWTTSGQTSDFPRLPSCLSLISAGSGYVTREYLNDEAVTDSSVPKTQELVVNRVCIGGRNGHSSVADFPQWYGNDNGSNRMFKGRLAELIVFSRALSAAERTKVEAYLHAKWFGSGDGALLAENPTFICVPSGRAIVTGTVRPTADRSEPSLAVAGNGTVNLAAEIVNRATLQVDARELELAPVARAASRAAIWVDASDLGSCQTDENNRVTNLVNKGSCGGSFVVAPALPSYAGEVRGPLLTGGGFDGSHASMYFDMDSALRLTSYTNKTETLDNRSIHVYAMICPKKAFGWYSFAFSFASLSQSGNNDHVQDGTLRLMHTDYGKYTLGCGGSKAVTLNASSLMKAKEGEESILCVAHLGRSGGSFGFEGATWSTGCVRSFSYQDLGGGGFDVDAVLLGGRFTKNANAAYLDPGSADANRLWRGYVGEFIVFDDPLSTEEEDALLSYLKKKWMNKGNGLEMPPSFLSGNWGEPVLDDGALVLGDETIVRHSTASLPVRELSVGENVSWMRQLEEGHSSEMFSVLGNMSFAGPQIVTVDGLSPDFKLDRLIAGSTAGVRDECWRAASVNYRVVVRPDGIWLKRQRGSAIIVR